MNEMTRIERDSMGESNVPIAAWYGAQTQRAIENFDISGLQLPAPFVRALGLIKSIAVTARRLIVSASWAWYAAQSFAVSAYQKRFRASRNWDSQ